jgi:hypothetical protein
MLFVNIKGIKQIKFLKSKIIITVLEAKDIEFFVL